MPKGKATSHYTKNRPTGYKSDTPLNFKIVREEILKDQTYHWRNPRWADLMHRGKDGQWRKIMQFKTIDEALIALGKALGYGFLYEKS